MSTPRILLLCLCIIMVMPCIGQPGGGDPPDPEVPITGIEILIGIGSLFGASRFLKGKNKSKES